MRTLFAALCGLVAAALLPLSVTSVWTDAVIGDTDRYVQTVAPLSDDEVVREAAAVELERQALRVVENASPLLARREATKRLIGEVVQGAVHGPAFKTAWEQANRSAHQQVLEVLEGDAPVDDRGGVSIDLGAVLDSIVTSLVEQGLLTDAVQLPQVQAPVEVLDADRLAQARRVYVALDRLGFWLPVAWVVLVLLTVMLAHRRLVATVRLAVGSLLMLGVLALGLWWARTALTDDLTNPALARAVWDVLVASLWHAIEAVAAFTAVVAVAAGLGLLALRRRTSTEPADPEPGR